MVCLFHKWDGCKCSKCGKTRDEQHDWDSDLVSTSITSVYAGDPTYDYQIGEEVCEIYRCKKCSKNKEEKRTHLFDEYKHLG